MTQDRGPVSADWLTKAELAALTPEVLAQRVRELVPLAAKHAQEAEQIRKPVDAVWNALRRSGIFYHFVPKKFGGLEFGIEDFVDIMLPLGEGCASTAWVATFCMEHNWILSRYSATAQEEIFSAFPYVIAPGLIQPPCKMVKVDGGWRVTGRMKWGTGIMHADWVLGTGMADGAPGQMRSFIVPESETSIVDVWHVDGMAGTGSNDVVFDNIFVPDHHSIDTSAASEYDAPGLKVNPNPIYRVPKVPFLTLTAAIPVVGAARGAVSWFCNYQKKRMVMGTTSAHTDRPVMQMRLGRAHMNAQSAEAVLRNAARRMSEFAERSGPLSVEERMNLRTEIAHSVELAREAVHGLIETAGSSAHFLDNPLQRIFRDVTVMSSHVVFDYDMVTEQHGRVLLGMPPTTPLF